MQFVFCQKLNYDIPLQNQKTFLFISSINFIARVGRMVEKLLKYPLSLEKVFGFIGFEITLPHSPDNNPLRLHLA